MENLPPFDPDAYFDAVLGDILDFNGCIVAGLAGQGEFGLPEQERIPLPANLHKVLTKDDNWRVVKWIKDKSTAAFPNRPMVVASHVAAYMCGAVAFKSKFNKEAEAAVNRRPVGYSRPPMPTTRDGWAALDWDAEVNIVNEEVPEIGIGKAVDSGFMDSIGMTAEFKNLIARATTSVVGAKLTHYQTQHHVGIAGPNGVHQGYLNKIVSSMGIQNFDLTSRANTSYVYQAVHPWSTLFIIKALFDGHADAALVRPVYSVPYAQEGWVPKFRKIAFAADVVLRARGCQAGFAKLSDIVAGLRQVIPSLIGPFVPGIAEIGYVMREITAVLASPVTHGLNANYYTGGRATLEKTAVENYQTLLAGVAVYVKVMNPNSSLTRAAVFSGPAADMPGFDPQWAQTVGQWATYLARASTLTPAAFDALARINGIGSGGALNPTQIQSLHTLGICVNENTYNQALATVNSINGGQPIPIQNPPPIAQQQGPQQQGQNAPPPAQPNQPAPNVAPAVDPAGGAPGAPGGAPNNDGGH